MTVARLGGDEFAVIVPGVLLGSAYASTVDEILKGVADTLTIDESVLPVSISAGAAVWPADGADAEEVLKKRRPRALRESEGRGCRDHT